MHPRQNPVELVEAAAAFELGAAWRVLRLDSRRRAVRIDGKRDQLGDEGDIGV
jgi:hypothetical protein